MTQTSIRTEPVANDQDPGLDVSGRPLTLREVDLDRFFHPKTVAIVGASDTPGRPNSGITRQLLAWAERVGATAHPVNPGRPSVYGLTCQPSLAGIPEPIDVAAVLVSDPGPVIAELIEVDAAFAVVFASGFAETGEGGKAEQDRLAGLVRGTGLRLLGPNTNLNAFENFRADLPGRSIALISQSGHQGRPIFQAQEIGVKMSHWAPTGNEADLEFADFVRHFADTDGVGVIAAYVEGFADGRTMLLAADHAARRGVPIVVVKVGRTDAGAAMASSHTGKLTGSDTVATAAFRQSGMIRVDGLDELLDTSALLARAEPPQTDGVCVYAISGGTGAHLADLAARAGLKLPRLTDATQKALRQWIPGYLHIANPVDNGGHPVGDERGRKILDAILADPRVGVLICPITGAFPPMSDRLAQDLVDAAETTGKPICVIWGSPVGTESAYRDILLGSSRIAVFRTFANCVNAVSAYLEYHDFRRCHTSPFETVPRRPTTAAAKVHRLLAPGRPVSEWQAKQILRAYGIRIPREQLVTSAAAAVRAAGTIGFPVVMKACGPRLQHKSDYGLVHLGLTSASQVRETYKEITDAAEEAGFDDLEGVIIGQHVRGGVETMVGVSRDPLFGPTVTVGLGGVFAEALGDVTVRVPPFEDREARRMLTELRGYPLLQGVRGRPPADVDSLVDVVLRVQRMALELGDVLGELDINPLMILPRGGGAVALDALAVPRIREM